MHIAVFFCVQRLLCVDNIGTTIALARAPLIMNPARTLNHADRTNED